MPCELRLGGSKEAVQRFVARNFLVPDAVFEKGINICVSDAGFDDVQGQIEEAIAFLETSGEQLYEICKSFGIERARLDFGLEQKDTWTQGCTLPADLLYLAGSYNIDIELSLYPVSNPEPDAGEAAG